MSVDVKTPTRTQFEHTEFPCGDRSGHVLVPTVTTVSVGGIALHSQDAVVMEQQTTEAQQQPEPGNKFHRKRKLSERTGNIHQSGSRKKSYRKSGDKIVLPSKFLLGGNITDPLNLNALCHDEIGKALNQCTPQSSPLPTLAYKQEVQVLIPPNINDPLNLNAGEEVDVGLISPKFGSKKKKHKHKKKRPSTGAGDKSEGETEAAQIEKSPQPESSRPVMLDLSSVKDTTANDPNDSTLSEKPLKVQDQIVSPVIPQLPPKSKKVKRLSGECSKSDVEPPTSVDNEDAESRKTTPLKPKPKRQISQQTSSHCRKNEKDKNRYIYGNYARYYGYRNPEFEDDNRLRCFRTEWFKGKDVLDIGCNIGHISLTIARDFQPRRIVGMDIDGKLISVAKKNIRHYMTKEATDTSKFPESLLQTYGPIAPPPVPSTKDASGFPYNVMFVQGNYALKTDEELDLVQEEYDAILALSLTKWIHLNWGDAGMKRVFKRFHRQLKPGGKLILEPQPWSSYKRKKKTSDIIFKNFQQIKFRPEQFTEYLLSKEVGFVACEHLDIPFNRSQGFQRPIQVFMKAESGSTPIEGVTPLMDINCTPSNTTPQVYVTNPYKDNSCTATPRLDVGSSGITPCSSCQNTPTYMYSTGTWSASATPKNDSDTGDAGTPGRHEHEFNHVRTNSQEQSDSRDHFMSDNG